MKRTKTGVFPYLQPDGSTLWGANSVWPDELIYVDIYTTNNGGHRFRFKSLLTDIGYEVMAKDFGKFVPYMEFGKVKGNFTFTKSSTSYYLKIVELK